MAGTSTEPRSGLFDHTDVQPGDGGWAGNLITNTLAIGRLAFPNLHALDRNLTAPPASPADGAAYIVAPAATGAWAGHVDDIAIWDQSSTTWGFYTPSIGWLCYLHDEQVITAYKATGWSAGVAV